MELEGEPFRMCWGAEPVNQYDSLSIVSILAAHWHQESQCDGKY